MRVQSLSWPMGAALTLLAGSGAMAQMATGGVSPPAIPAMPATGQAIDSGFEASGIPGGGVYAPRAIRLMDGGLFVTPTLGVAFGHNDNVALEPAATAQSSNFVTISPRLLGEIAYRANRYSLAYQGEVVRYSASSSDNVENHELSATGLHGLDTRTTVNWRAAVSDKYDPVGSTDRSVAAATPDRWVGANLLLAGRYGAEGAQGRVEGQIGYFHKQYQNNRATTRSGDFDSVDMLLRFHYRVAPKTRLVTEFRHAVFDYQQDTGNLDGTEQRLLFGAEWDATAATTGSVKIGYLDKSYDGPRRGYSGVTWEAAVTWEPRTYSEVRLSTGRAAVDPSGDNSNFVLATVYNAAWTHKWTSFLSTRLSYGYNGGAFNGTGRRDRTDSLGLAMNYDVNRTMKVGAQIQQAKRDSNVAVYDYKRNLLTVFAEIAF